MANDKVLIQSNFDSLDLYRMVETDFNKYIFDFREDEYVPGLFDFRDAISTSDIWEIKDKAELPPIPLKKENENMYHNLSAGYFCERPAYIPMVEGAYIYPLGDDELCRVPTDIYLGNKNYEIPVIREKLEESKEKVYNYNKEYKEDSIYSTEFNTYYLGSTSSSSYIYNLLKYNLGEVNWKSNWSENAIATSITDNIFFTSDLTEIKEKADNNEDILFTSTLKNVESGTYCLSFFARVYDTIYRESGEEEVDYRQSDPVFLTTNPCRSWIKVITDDFDSIKYVLHNGLEYSQSDGFVGIDSIWRRFGLIFTIDSFRSSLNIQIKWPKNYIKGVLQENRLLPIRIGGLLLEKQSYPSVYDKRYVIYDNSGITKAKYHPLAIYFGENNDLSTRSWTINYRRFIEAKAEAESSFLDCLGRVSFGYMDNRAVILVDGQVKVYKELKNANDFYNHQESVFVSFDKETLELSIKAVCNKGSYDITTTIDDPQVFNEITITGEKYKYHLLLGGTDSKSLKTGYYSNVIFIPRILTEEEVDSMINSYFTISLSTYRYNRDYIKSPPEELEELSWEQFKNLNSANLDSVYKLTSGSEEETELEKIYHKGDILFCVIPFNEKLNIKDIPIYWSYTAFVVDKYWDVPDSTIMKAPLIIEGYEKIVEKGNPLIED